jgi:hypothetical protein
MPPGLFLSDLAQLDIGDALDACTSLFQTVSPCLIRMISMKGQPL